MVLLSSRAGSSRHAAAAARRGNNFINAVAPVARQTPALAAYNAARGGASSREQSAAADAVRAGLDGAGGGGGFVNAAFRPQVSGSWGRRAESKAQTFEDLYPALPKARRKKKKPPLRPVPYGGRQQKVGLTGYSVAQHDSSTSLMGRAWNAANLGNSGGGTVGSDHQLEKYRPHCSSIRTVDLKPVESFQGARSFESLSATAGSAAFGGAHPSTRYPARACTASNAFRSAASPQPSRSKGSGSSAKRKARSKPRKQGSGSGNVMALTAAAGGGSGRAAPKVSTMRRQGGYTLAPSPTLQGTSTEAGMPDEHVDWYLRYRLLVGWTSRLALLEDSVIPSKREWTGMRNEKFPCLPRTQRWVGI
eukprot:scaffold529_cov308-Pinguiococcus_pyrenoidosus.AAC.67